MTSSVSRVAPSAPELRWRQVYRGEERQLGALRRWLKLLLPECPARDDVISVVTELGTNAVRHTASGRGGWFAVEITWYGSVVRAAVADGGAPQGPRMIDDPLAEHGRGLVLVRELSVRTGVSGDHRGRLVWAEIPWGDRDGTESAAPPDPYEAAIRDGQADLADRFAGVPIWFGRSTLQWWALLSPARSGRLLTAPSARALAEQLDEALKPQRDTQRTANEHTGAARAEIQAGEPEAPVPPRIHRIKPHVSRLRAQPC